MPTPRDLLPPPVRDRLPTPLRDLLPDPLRGRFDDAEHQLRWRLAPTAKITRAYLRRHGAVVGAGPFAGMTYPPFAITRTELLVARLLGAFEHELHPAVERSIAFGPQQIVNVGAADGYYAVGMARACPAATIQAFEMNPWSLRVCRALAEANGVTGQIVFRGEATVDELNALPQAKTLVICDCEGCEAELLDPEAVPWLREAAVIVELHDFAVRGVSQTVLERFRPTHDVEVIDAVGRWRGEWPALEDVPGTTWIDKELGLSEFRAFPMQWGFMLPRAA